MKFKLLNMDNGEGEIQSETQDTKDQEILEVTEDELIDLKSLEIQEEGHIGIEFCPSIDNCALAVKDFAPGGTAKAADPNSKIEVGDILTSVNNNRIIQGKGPWIQKTYECLQKEGLSRPLIMTFIRPYMMTAVIEKEDCDLASDGPEEMVLRERKIQNGASKIFMNGFHGVNGAAESSGVILGDNLIFVNGMAVGAGTKLRPDGPTHNMAAIQSMIDDTNSYPMCLHFARQTSTDQRIVDFDVESDDMKSFSVTVLSPKQLGCKINQVGLNPVRFVVNQFHAVSGHFSSIISRSIRSSNMKDISFYSINGEVLPSYASCDMVKNAMKRGWKSGKLEIIFCDEKIKEQFTDQ